MKTIDYYNNHAQAFYDRTIHADITDSYQKFQKWLPERANILDAGCGVGRDVKYFLSQGHAVSAFDASEKMVELACRETGVRVTHSTFQQLSFENMFDGVWAQASLLHIPYDMTRDIYQKIYYSLKSNGIFYASYKYGNSYMETAERDFYNMNEDMIPSYFEGLFDVLEIWKKKGSRSQVAPSKEGMWLNFIVKKK